ncbi:hypothetical protein M407DRAFT_34206 [Tulasnella calospora MUT 4182]|uniref:Uncharacterized protein n=1 Tax=Tulasnella calospora MUT 4182 TaxID=1051891 RepID=A0A0C3PNY0_9AGAM|nr:hypothetical protein M407DRAFT_34206 [Tulasnella calospora MUT 4182]
MERCDWRLFGIVSFFVARHNDLRSGLLLHEDLLKNAYRNAGREYPFNILLEALEVIVAPAFKFLSYHKPLFICLLSCIDQTITTESTPERLTIEQTFSLLKLCEPILQSPHLPETVEQIIRKARLSVADSWQQECAVLRKGPISDRVINVLVQYTAKIRAIHPAQSGCHERINILRVFGPPTRRLLDYSNGDWQRDACEKRFALMKTFNEYVEEVDQTSRQMQNNARRVRDPDEHWCHHEEERVSIRTIYSLPPDRPESDWANVAQKLGIDSSYV